MSTLLSSHRSSIESMLCSVRSGNRPKNLAMNCELSLLQLSAPFTPARMGRLGCRSVSRKGGKHWGSEGGRGIGRGKGGLRGGPISASSV